MTELLFIALLCAFVGFVLGNLVMWLALQAGYRMGIVKYIGITGSEKP